MKLLLNELSSADIKINEPPPPITIEKTGANKVQVFYLTKEAKEIIDLINFTEKVKELVNANGIRNAIVKIYGNIKLDHIVDALTPSMVYKKAIIIATKGDLPHTEETFDKLKLNYSDKFPVIIGVSVKKQNFPNDFGDIILNFLNKIKIYTVNAGIVAERPLILDKYSTVREVAIKIHKSFFNLFDYAIINRKSARQERKKVGLEYELEDGDLIEIHTR